MKREAAVFKSLSDPIRLRLTAILAIHGEACVCDLAAAIGEPDFKVSRHLSILRASGLVEARREGTWMHCRLAQAPTPLIRALQSHLREYMRENVVIQEDIGRLEASVAERKLSCRGSQATKLVILFLCTGNSCRSQMAEGWARKLIGNQVDVYSAGIEKHGLNRRAVQVMAEVGVDISQHKSKTVGELPIRDFDFVITVCGHAKQRCPLFPGNARIVHVGFDDPPAMAQGAGTEEEALNHYRRVRDEIRAFVETLPQALETL